MAGGPEPNRPLIVFVIGLSTIMVMLDITVVNVALPYMEGGLNATREQITWVLTAYVIAMALATPLTGWLADRMGRRALFAFAMAGFTLASAFCGLASSVPQMVAARVLQGVFAAAVSPLGQAILLDITPRERHGRAMAVWAMATMLGPTLGPPLGGWLTDQFSWRWCFLINLPLGAVAAFGAWAWIRDAAKASARRLDMIGYLTLALGVVGFQLVLDRGPGRDWWVSQEIWVWTGLAVLGFYWFVAHSLTSARPLFSPQIARDVNFSSATLLAFVICLVLFSSVTLAPPLLQGVLGYTAFDSGVTLIPRGVATILSAFIVGRLTSRVDPRLILLAGVLLMVAGLLMMAQLSPMADRGPVMAASFVQGLGQGTFFVPVSTLAFATLAPQLRVDAAAAMGLVRNMGTSMGVSIVAMMQTVHEQQARSRLAEQLTDEVLAGRALAPGGVLGPGSQLDLFALVREATRQADLIAYVNTFHFMALLCVLPLPLLLLLRPRRGGA